MHPAMIPTHMLLQVGQQGHYEGHRQGHRQQTGNLPLNMFEQNGCVRRNEASPRYSLERRPLKSYSFEDVSRPFSDGMRYGPKSQQVFYGHAFPSQNCGHELLQLFNVDMSAVRLNYCGHPVSGRNGASAVSNGLAPWRDRGGGGGGGPNPMGGVGMAPPSSVPGGSRPITNRGDTKKVIWGNKGSYGDPRRSFHHKSPNDRRFPRSPPSRGGDGGSSEAYSSDSGFSSRSPTPSSQQVSPSGTRGGSGDEDNHIGAGDPALHRLSNNEDCKMVKRLHEMNGAPTPDNSQQFYQPFYQHHHRNQPPPPLHPGISLHHINQNTVHYNQKRSESMTSLTPQGPPPNGYQSKRRYSTGRHSPPAGSRNRGRRGVGYTGRPPSLSTNLPLCFIAPQRFLARSHLMYVTERPARLICGDGWDELSEAVWDKFMKHQQTEDTYRNKMKLWTSLYFYIKRSFPRYGLFLVGSTISGFGSDSSDMDMCLLVRHSEMIDQRSEAVGYLEQVLKCLRLCDLVRDPELIQAKVPILKFCDTKHNLEVDLNCNNAVGIRNTHLLYCYSQMDWRVRPLVLVVKMWAAKHGINDAKNMTISSYSLVLMVISYLQCGVSPSVLPNLHVMYPGKFSAESDPHTIDLHEELKPYKSSNTQSLGELLLAFLDYYANFDYSQNAISVRQARRVPIEECRHARSYKNDPHQWKYLCIEEPFDLTNTAHSVYDPEVFEKIKQVFVKSFRALKQSRDLESIFYSFLGDK